MGGGTTPLQIPWSKFLRDDGAPPPVLEIAGDDAGSSDEALGVETLADSELNNTIQRYRSNLSGDLHWRLPDKGVKLRARLRVLEEEVERRKVPRTTSESTISSEAQNYRTYSAPRFSPDRASQSTFASIFNQKLDSKADYSCSTAFSEELRSMNKDHKSAKQNGKQNAMIQRNPRMSSRQSRFKSPIDSCTPRLSNYFASCFNKGKIQDHIPREDHSEVHEVVCLDDEEETMLCDEPLKVKSVAWKEATVYYPSRNHHGCIEIGYSDVKALDPGSYLSSTIMNFYIQYLQKPFSALGGLSGEYHFFNTYFYKKLEEAVSSKVDRKANFVKLRRWLKGVNMFQKAYIFLPVHGNLHWSLAIICVPSKEEGSGPIILHLDSLGLHDTSYIFRNITRYLEEEWNHLYEDASPKDYPFSEIVWNCLPSTIQTKKIAVPQQENVYDCGLFVLYFMEKFIREAPDRVKLKDLDMFGRKWFRAEEASGLRRRIKELLLEELEDARLEVNDVESSASSVSSLEDDCSLCEHL